LMGACTYAITFIGLNNWLTLIIQIAVGIATYIAFSALFRLSGFKFVLSQLKSFLNKKTKKTEEQK